MFSPHLHGFFLQQSKDLHIRPDVECEPTLLLVFQFVSSEVKAALHPSSSQGHAERPKNKLLPSYPPFEKHNGIADANGANYGGASECGGARAAYVSWLGS